MIKRGLWNSLFLFIPFSYIYVLQTEKLKVNSSLCLCPYGSGEKVNAATREQTGTKLAPRKQGRIALETPSRCLVLRALRRE